MTELQTRPRHLLVVEDDDDTRESLIEQLRTSGYEVSGAATGSRAFERMREPPVVDLVVLDLMLPEMNGWEFRLKQRADPELAHIPVVVISADATAKAAAIDAAAFVKKPFKLATLTAEIARVLNLLERERARVMSLAQIERLASLGMLAAGVGHEINNPLTYVLSNLEYVAKELKHDNLPPAMVRELRDVVGEAREGAERIRKIVRDLRAFSRTGEERREIVDLRRALELAINMSWNELRHRARLVKQLGPAPMVEGDESRISQVFVNLLVNAAQALEECNADANEVRLTLSTDSRGYAVVEVRDTGHGISDADLPKIFDPFFTSKGNAGGTGLGLSIVHETVRKYGGEVDVSSKVGQGTGFRVYLPPWKPISDAPVANVNARDKSSSRGRVLIVDDDPIVARALARGIRDEHDVTIAASGVEALTLMNEMREWDLILCDVMMPHMGGIEFWERSTRLSPLVAQKIVFMTGGAFSPVAQAFLDEVQLPRFEKPVDLNNVVALINERVAARSGNR